MKRKRRWKESEVFVKWNEKHVPADIRRVRKQKYKDSKSEIKRIIRESTKWMKIME